MKNEQCFFVAQNTGNPVLDSLVNLLAGGGVQTIETIESLHACLLKLALQEPGGLNRSKATGSSLKTGKRHAQQGSLLDD